MTTVSFPGGEGYVIIDSAKPTSSSSPGLDLTSILRHDQHQWRPYLGLAVTVILKGKGCAMPARNRGRDPKDHEIGTA